MKARELAKILMQHPDAEVTHYEYVGGPTPLLKIDTVRHECKGEVSENQDGGHFIKEDGIVEKDLVILMYTNYENE